MRQRRPRAASARVASSLPCRSSPPRSSCTRWSSAAPVSSRCRAQTLTLAALSAPAHAGLSIASFSVFASGYALDSGFDHSAAVDLADDEPYSLPYTLLATAQMGSGFGAALQDKGGFFRSRSNVAVTDYFTTHFVNAYASTAYHVVVSTDQPDTPLTVKFNFFGASASVLSQYQSGDVNASIYASIRAERRDKDDGVVVLETDDEKWAIYRQVDLSGAWNGRSVDEQNIGMPSQHFVSDYLPLTFDYEAKLTLDAFSGTLDFGVLQPGEFFAFEYRSLVDTNVNFLPYTGRANALVVDPFSLEQPPEFQFSIVGLQLPTAPVPEPTSSLLMLAGLGWLGWRRMR